MKTKEEIQVQIDVLKNIIDSFMIDKSDKETLQIHIKKLEIEAENTKSINEYLEDAFNSSRIVFQERGKYHKYQYNTFNDYLKHINR